MKSNSIYYLGKSCISLTEEFNTVCFSEPVVKTASAGINDSKSRKL